MPAGDAIALLTDRIAAIRPGWRPDATESGQLARLAAALDGIPLALELAAARCRVVGLGELLDMLSDRFPAPGFRQLGPVPRGALAPHETLEAAIAWSVDLLSTGDRAMLLGLWPFEGGFTLSAVDGDLDTLSSLVARSVVDQAKGILMHALGCDADDALRRLRQESQRRHVKVTEVAAEVVARAKGGKGGAKPGARPRSG